jgi:hypothetical protein
VKPHQITIHENINAEVYTVSLASAVSCVLGKIGFPDASETGDMSEAHRIVAMRMNSELLAMWRPTQCLKWTIVSKNVRVAGIWYTLNQSPTEDQGVQINSCREKWNRHIQMSHVLLKGKLHSSSPVYALEPRGSYLLRLRR